jgi:hypothetical protein
MPQSFNPANFHNLLILFKYVTVYPKSPKCPTKIYIPSMFFIRIKAMTEKFFKAKLLNKPMLKRRESGVYCHLEISCLFNGRRQHHNCFLFGDSAIKAADTLKKGKWLKLTPEEPADLIHYANPQTGTTRRGLVFTVVF